MASHPAPLKLLALGLHSYFVWYWGKQLLGDPSEARPERGVGLLGSAGAQAKYHAKGQKIIEAFRNERRQKLQKVRGSAQMGQVAGKFADLGPIGSRVGVLRDLVRRYSGADAAAMRNPQHVAQVGALTEAVREVVAQRCKPADEEKGDGGWCAPEKDWKAELMEPKVSLPLLYALLTTLLLAFLFGPFAKFLKRYIEALVQKPAAEINVESNIEPPEEEGEGGGGGGGGPEEGKLDIMIGQKPPEPPPELEDESMKKFEPFSYINETNLKRLANLFLLRREEPWLIAVVLSYLKPDFARQVLSGLPVGLQTKVALEALKVRQVTREQVQAIDAEVKENIDFVVGGVERLIHLIEESDPATRNNILESLQNEKPVVYEYVRKAILLFDDIAGFPDREMQTVVRELKTETMSRALQGASPEVVNKFFANMSAGAGSLLKESMEYTKGVTPAQTEEQRGKIMDKVKAMEKEGKITVRAGADAEAFQEVLAMSPRRPAGRKDDEDEAPLGAAEIAKEVASIQKGRAGGRPDFAQGGGPDADWEDIVNRVKEMVRVKVQ